MAEQTGVTGTLTDGTGVSNFTVNKVVKDLFIDFVKTLAAVLVANGIVDVNHALNDPKSLLIAGIGAAISTGYRWVLSLQTS